jgi:hypothetical protein
LSQHVFIRSICVLNSLVFINTEECLTKVKIQTFGLSTELGNKRPVVTLDATASINFKTYLVVLFGGNHSHSVIVRVKVLFFNALLGGPEVLPKEVLCAIIVVVGFPNTHNIGSTVIVTTAVCIAGTKGDIARATAKSGIGDRDIICFGFSVNLRRVDDVVFLRESQGQRDQGAK